MKKILVLGVGLVAGPLVRYLQQRPDMALTLADINQEAAARWAARSPSSRAVGLDIADTAASESLIADHDIVVSLLPAPLHPKIARLCLERGRHLLTASYNSDEMRAFDAEARKKGLTLLGECGLDPGLDHMSAMRIIDAARERGARVVSFRSYCGGLPAPEANDNPIGYKFSWSPRGVLSAATNPGRYRQDGQIVEVDGSELFAKPEVVQIPGLPALEGYPNRDSLPYQQIYGLNDARTMFRGTLRHEGHCDQWYRWVHLGLLSQVPFQAPQPRTNRDFIACSAGTDGLDPREEVARQLGVPVEHPAVQALDWLEAFGDRALPESARAPIDVMASLMLDKCRFGANERDLVVLRHEFEIENDNQHEHVDSTLVAYGQPGGDSAMARTVGLPLAIATRLIAEGTIKRRGVIAPIYPEVYRPVLTELEAEGVRFEEVTTPVA